MSSGAVALGMALAFLALCVAIYTLPVPQETTPTWDELAQPTKTLYMELCAEEGISAYHCLDRWLEIKNDNYCSN